MKKTEIDGSIHIVPDPDIRDLPPAEIPYAIKYGLEAINSALSCVRDHLDFMHEVDRLIAVIEKEKANKYQGKTNKTRELHRRIYKIMCNLEKIYRLDNLRKPSFQEHGENLANKEIFGYSGKPYAERALREIKILGNEGRL